MKGLIILSTISLVLQTSCYSTKKIPITFSEPITDDVSGTKDELFLKSNLWMVTTFNDARSVIQYSDKAEGVLTGKYLLKYTPSAYKVPEEVIYAIIEIRVKDGKAFISIKPNDWNYNQMYNPAGQEYGKTVKYSKEMAIADIDILCNSYIKRLQTVNSEF